MTHILVLGGTGKTGSRIARLLEPEYSVRTASRTGGDVRFDYDDPTSWASALENVTAAYVVEPDLQASIDDRERIPMFVAEAVAASVRRLALLSAYGVGEAGDAHPLAPAEQAVRGSGAEWTILRPDWFSQNFSEGFWLPGILDGTLSMPTGEGGTPFIDTEDIAEVAAVALTQDGHAGQAYQLTGPRAVSFGEAADLIGKATGRSIRHVDVDPEAFVEHSVAAGAPLEVARRLTDVLLAVRDGRGATVSDSVERVLDRPPRRFEDFVTDVAATGAWRPRRAGIGTRS